MTKDKPRAYASLGELITDRLTVLNMTKAELARKVGVTAQYIGEFISGDKDNPNREIIEALSNHLNVSKLEVLVALKYLPPEMLGDPNEERMLEQFRRLPDDKKEVAEVILASLNTHYGNGKSNGPISVAMEHPKRKQRAGKKP